MKLLVLIGAILGLALAPASTQTGKQSAPGQLETTPGQKQKYPGQAKKLAPGQKQKNPGEAKDLAPGRAPPPKVR
jgi:hypothetical protein